MHSGESIMLRVGHGRPLGKGSGLPLAGPFLLLQPREEFLLPLEQRLDPRSEPGDLRSEPDGLGFERDVPRFQFSDPRPERGVLRLELGHPPLQLLITGPSTIHGRHSLTDRTSQGKINSQGGKLGRIRSITFGRTGASEAEMIILGDISGIQNYVFNVAEEGGGQAQRLRARSFFVQLLAETAALRLVRALEWPLDSILLSGAGKFLLRGSNAPEVEKRLAGEQLWIEEWLLRETRAELRLTIAWADSGSEIASYQEAQRRLQRSKARPWAPVPGNGWDPSRLLLTPLDTPCDLCRHASATQPEQDRDTGQVRQVCRGCAWNRVIGRCLPRSRWLVIRGRAAGSGDVLGFGVDVATNAPPAIGRETVAVANHRDPDVRPSWCPEDRFLKRRLMAHVPTDDEGIPVWFTELAKRSWGDPLLAVLKADADSLGVCFEHLLKTNGLAALQSFSDRLDAFFAGRLRQELANHAGRWQSI
jgi:CRISPR-associated protein Cas10/Csm1 subtype III-A